MLGMNESLIVFISNFKLPRWDLLLVEDSKNQEASKFKNHTNRALTVKVRPIILVNHCVTTYHALLTKEVLNT